MTATDANPGLDFATAQRRYAAIKRQREESRQTYHDQKVIVANKKHDHTKAFAQRFLHHRADGKGVEESKILAKGDTAHIELEHDLADVEWRTAEKRLEELEAGRATVRQLADWTREEN